MKLMNYELLIMNYGLLLMTYELWVMNYHLSTINYGFWIMSYHLSIMNLCSDCSGGSFRGHSGIISGSFQVIPVVPELQISKTYDSFSWNTCISVCIFVNGFYIFRFRFFLQLLICLHFVCSFGILLCNHVVKCCWGDSYK